MIFGRWKKEALFFTQSHMILTKIDQRVFSFETNNNVVIKQYIINNFKMKIS